VAKEAHPGLRKDSFRKGSSRMGNPPCSTWAVTLRQMLPILKAISRGATALTIMWGGKSLKGPRIDSAG